MVSDLRTPAPIVGILGGMGPAASSAFYSRLTDLTPAGTDQEHLTVLLWSDPGIPDRSAALLSAGPDPSARMLHGLSLLETAGATLIAVPCNTAHYFLRKLRAQVGVRVMDMVSETCRAVRELSPPTRLTGLLGTAGLVAGGMYQEGLSAVGIDSVTPSRQDQAAVDRAIALVKAGDVGQAATLLSRCARVLVERGCDTVIAGCTEIPLALPANSVGARLIDPGLVLAQKTVSYAIRQRYERVR